MAVVLEKIMQGFYALLWVLQENLKVGIIVQDFC